MQLIGADFRLEVNEFDGKVVYGAKRQANAGISYEYHIKELSSKVEELAKLEAEAQKNFLKILSMKV